MEGVKTLRLTTKAAGNCVEYNSPGKKDTVCLLGESGGNYYVRKYDA